MFIVKLENTIKENVSNIINEKYEINNVEVHLENPKDLKNGNYSTNIALALTKQLRRNPMEIANEIVDALKTKEIENVLTIEAANPGFININMDSEFYKKSVDDSRDTNFRLENEDKNKYLIEYVSANPTGDLHLGHARNAIYGSSLVNVMRKAGYEVSTEYYLNDAGNQMNNLGLSVRYFYLELCGIEVEFPNDGYRGKDIQNISQKLFNEFGDSKKDEDLSFFVEYGYVVNLTNIKDLLKKMNIEFDSWVSEKKLYLDNKVSESLNVLEKQGDVYNEDGAVWLATSKYEDDKDRVLKKNDGSFTYFTADIAYHIDKYERGYDYLIDIWGADHHGYIPRVKSAIESLGKDKEKFQVLLIQMVSILENNVAVKMSKRAGTSVTINDMLEHIDIDSLRYFFVMRAPETQLDFDIEVAKKKDSDNPIYYIQYASARINSVMKKFNEEYDGVDKYELNYSNLEKEIILYLSKYQKVILDCAKKRAPHILTNYLYDLVTLYHRYYNNEKVFTDNNDEVFKKIDIYSSINEVIKDALNLLGIKAKEEM